MLWGRMRRISSMEPGAFIVSCCVYHHELRIDIIIIIICNALHLSYSLLWYILLSLLNDRYHILIWLIALHRYDYCYCICIAIIIIIIRRSPRRRSARPRRGCGSGPIVMIIVCCVMLCYVMLYVYIYIYIYIYHIIV